MAHSRCNALWRLVEAPLELGAVVSEEAFRTGSRRCGAGRVAGVFPLAFAPSPKSLVAPKGHHHPGRFHVTFKMLKRQLYGRGGPDLLRRRALLAN